MITAKKPEEIKILKEGGAILASILASLKKEVGPGINTLYLDELAEKLVKEKGGEPSFKNYGQPPFCSTICASVNKEVVHAPASKDKVLREGDILSIDIGMKYRGLYTDMAITVPVGNIGERARRIMEVTKKSLDMGIKEIRPGAPLNNIGKAIQKYVERQGYSVVRVLSGHGVGYEVHEEPAIFNFDNSRAKKVILKEGMVLAIEPMVCEGSFEVETNVDDGWTVVTKDGKLSAHFEHTVVVTNDGVEILTLL